MKIMSNSDATDLISLAKRIPELDAEYAIGLIGGSEPLYEKTLRAAVLLIPERVEQMDAHIGGGGGLSEFAVKAHGLKGSLNQVGYFKLAELAESLEKAAKEGNRTYCAAHYGAFREELLRFYGLLCEAEPQKSARDSSVSSESLFDTVLRARGAAVEFDALGASDILEPLAGRDFGGNTSDLISKAVGALRVFNHKRALDYIEELLEACNGPATSRAKEEIL